MENKNILRIIDANLNRSREGLRVCEDIVRFLLNDAKAARRLKDIRQSIFTAIKTSKISYLELLSQRDSAHDVGKITTKKELCRPNWQSVFMANIERAKESTRVLEELSKTVNENLAKKFKKIRFAIYEAEKAIITKRKSLSYSKHNRL